MNSVRTAWTWLSRTYGGLVSLASPEPVAESPRALVYACRMADREGVPPSPMLTSAVAVPHNGSSPFHPATDDPFGDLAAHATEGTPRTPRQQAFRTNARGCVLAADAAVDGFAAAALPWQPEHELPGWWDRMVRTHFPTAEVATCGTWDEAISAVLATGDDSRGVIWVRRELGGHEFTGHLVYAHNNGGQVIVLDAQAGRLAELEETNLRGLVLARFHRHRVPSPEPEPWRRPAATFDDALAKAKAWLELKYAGELVLTDPAPDDELRRGWLFACSTARYEARHDWRDQTLDGALVVPKDDGIPFGLPNSKPWDWLRRWDLGEVAADDAPDPGPASWYAATMPRLGPVLATSVHPDVGSAIGALIRFPQDARALVWLRRRDRRGRESVGVLFNALLGKREPVLIDSTTGRPAQPEWDGVLAVHVIRYR
jgi:hypothetical protein